MLSAAVQPRARGALSVPAAASTLTPSWLFAPVAPAMVAAVFPTAAYLRREGAGEVLPVLAPGALDLPGGVKVVDAKDFQALDLRAGEQVLVGQGRVTTPAGSLHVARTWRPRRVGAGSVPARRLADLRQVVGALAPVVDVPVQAAAVDLVGLGPGLTPAGDDLLCGRLLALRALGETHRLETLWAEVEPLCGRTTDLSSTLLRQAAEGYAVPPVLALLDLLATPLTDPDPSPRSLTDAVRGVSGIGHTSGAALLLGLTTTAGPHADLIHRPDPREDRS